MDDRSPGWVVLRVLVYLVGATVVFLPVLVAKPILGFWATVVQLGLTVALAGATRWSRLDDVGMRSFARSLFAASLGLTCMSLVDVEQLGIPLDTAWGIALAKFVESSTVVGFALAALWWMQVPVEDVYVTGGRVTRGLTVGGALFVGIVVLGTVRPGGEGMTAALAEHWPFVGVFVFANALMEEFLFRGLFLKWLSEGVGSVLAVLASSLVFAVAHLQVAYTSPEELVGFVVVVFGLGVLWAMLALWTRSLLAPVLFHAGADVVMIGEIFESLGV